MSEYTGQWAIMPAMVRYDKSLPANAKLIYAEIAAKINEEGWCFCHNGYFAERFGLRPDTVSNLIKRLEAAGYITVDVNVARTNNNRRRIYLAEKPYHFNVMGGLGFKSGTVSDLNPRPIENNNIKNNTPYSPPQGDGEPPPKKKRKRDKAVPEHEPEMFERFWTAYPRGNDRQGAVREWDALKPDRKLMFEMSAALERQKKSDEWRRGVGIPYACRWLSKRRWEDEERQPLADAQQSQTSPYWADTGGVL